MYSPFFVLLSAVATSLAYPSLVYSPLAAVPAVIPAAVPAVLKSQYHAQDELGQYSYGYTDGVSAKAEAKTFDGVTRGGYSYLDSNGIVQNVNYVSDAAGFRVAASNLPVAPIPPPAPLPIAPLPVVDTPEVAAAKAAHLSALKEEAETAASPEVAATPEAEPEAPATEAPAPVEPAPAPEAVPAPVEAKVAPVPAPLPAVVPASIPVPAATPYVVAPAPVVPAPIAPIVPAPIVAAPAPVVYSAPVPAPIVAAPLTSQYHSQDELGQYSYGYIGGPSSKAEVRTFDGITRGGYAYLDSHGLVQSTNYVSDPVNGFRVAATNLPVAPGPVAIPDSPEVAAAKAKHFQLLAKAAAEAAEKPE